MIRVWMAGFPGNELIETHEGTTAADVKKVLGQWMEKGDKVVALESAGLADGRTMTPYVIATPNGDSDIFAQLIK